MYRNLLFDPIRQIDAFAKMMQDDIDAKARFTNSERGFLPQLDIASDDKEIIIRADMPGMSKEDIKISVNDENILTLSGSKKRVLEEDEGKKEIIRSERNFGEFSRQFRLPDDIDSEKLKANFENGVLRMSIGIKEPEKPKEITVNIE